MRAHSTFDLTHPAWVRGLIAFIAAGVALYLAGMIWSGWGQVLSSWQHIGVALICSAAVAASSAYLLRFLRWQYCLVSLGHRVPPLRSFGVYLAGLALTTSPGKIGETVRSLLLLRDGVPAKHSFATFLADRLSDVIGVCVLAVLASAAGGKLSWGIVLAVLTVVGGSLMLRQLLRGAAANGLWAWLEQRLPRLPWRWVRDVLNTWARLWTVPRMLAFALTALFAYGIQAGVFVALCMQVGVPLGLAQGVSFFANATLFGAASMVPGGLGAMEAALVWQLATIGVAHTQAVAIAIATRLVTLWLGIALG
ncbi:MAG: flippase-like domain-containing protein [Uliginosibacterium sp.]|nr:flippase-like domain-containing protein [Uliginosibacterium sp.]